MSELPADVQRALRFLPKYATPAKRSPVEQAHLRAANRLLRGSR